MSLWTNLFVLSYLVFSAPMAFAQGEQPPTVQPATKGSTIKIDGRLFGGIFASGKDGSYANRSFDVPDAKLRFTFAPSQYLVVVNRFSNPQAKSGGFDYFYIEIKDWHGLLPGHSVRLGKVKMDVGQETWTDNPVESILISNSAPIISGYDEGVHSFGKVVANDKLNYSLSLLNGSKDFSLSADGFALALKLSTNPVSPLFFSASYYMSGELKRDTLLLESDLKIGNLTKAPPGTKSWKRNLWEVDLRWNYGPKGISPTIGGSPKNRFQLAAAFGQFTDDLNPIPDRKGSYWFAEGLLNITGKAFLAARLSDIKLEKKATDKLAGSPVAINEYQRLSVGFGYRLSDNVVAKIEGTQNSVKGAEIDQLAAGLAVKL